MLPLMVNKDEYIITFWYRLPDINKVLLQITDAMKFSSVLPRPKIAQKVNKISIIKHNTILLLITVSHLTSYHWDMCILRLNSYYYGLKISQGKVSTLNRKVGI